MAAKHVVVLPYDSAWAQDFKDIETELREALGELAVSVEHVGSTSVHGARDRNEMVFHAKAGAGKRGSQVLPENG